MLEMEISRVLVGPRNDQQLVPAEKRIRKQITAEDALLTAKK
jgi:hypothetical protein